MESHRTPQSDSILPKGTNPEEVTICVAINFWQEHKAWSDDLASLWLEVQPENSEEKIWAAWDNAPNHVQNSVIQGFMPDSNQEIKVWIGKVKDRYEIVGLIQRSKN